MDAAVAVAAAAAPVATDDDYSKDNENDDDDDDYNAVFYNTVRFLASIAKTGSPPFPTYVIFCKFNAWSLFYIVPLAATLLYSISLVNRLFVQRFIQGDKKDHGPFVRESTDSCRHLITPGRVKCITMASYWARRRLKSPASQLFTQPFVQVQIKKNIKAPRHWPLCGEFTGYRWIPHTKGQ